MSNQAGGEGRSREESKSSFRTAGEDDSKRESTESEALWGAVGAEATKWERSIEQWPHDAESSMESEKSITHIHTGALAPTDTVSPLTHLTTSRPNGHEKTLSHTHTHTHTHTAHTQGTHAGTHAHALSVVRSSSEISAACRAGSRGGMWGVEVVGSTRDAASSSVTASRHTSC